MMEKKYEVIVNYIEKLMLEKVLKQGDRLPSIRNMAGQFGCNKSTIIRAYQQLENAHKIYSIPKGGYYVVEKPSTSVEISEIIDFTEVMPDPQLLPYKEFNHCINRAVDLYKDSLFTYSDGQGLLTLRKSLSAHFSNFQVFTTTNNIFITTGAQQALSILTKMHFPNRKKNILVEEPTYGIMKKLIQLNGVKLIGIPRNFNGIDFEKLEEIFQNEDIKFFYTIPRFHNPLGTSYSTKDKQKIAGLASKYNVYIVEDDYLVDIDINKKRLPLYYYDESGHVIYVKSFSKALMPGIRIGAVVLNESLHEEFLLHKKCSDLNTSVLAQGALEIFINSGMYQKHLTKVQRKYRDKMNCLHQTLTQIKEVDFIVPETGFFISFGLSNKLNLELLIHRLKERNVLISKTDENKTLDRKEHRVHICISKLSELQIKKGISILCEELEKLRH